MVGALDRHWYGGHFTQQPASRGWLRMVPTIDSGTQRHYDIIWFARAQENVYRSITNQWSMPEGCRIVCKGNRDFRRYKLEAVCKTSEVITIFAGAITHRISDEQRKRSVRSSMIQIKSEALSLVGGKSALVVPWGWRKFYALLRVCVTVHLVQTLAYGMSRASMIPAPL